MVLTYSCLYREGGKEGEGKGERRGRTGRGEESREKERRDEGMGGGSQLLLADTLPML